MPKRLPVVFAYVVVHSERKHDPTLDVSHAPLLPAIGEIVVFPDHQGAVAIREEDHGMLVDIIHLHLLCTGEKLPDGNVDFSFEGKRLLALVQIGANNERVLHDEVDRVFEKIEALVGPMIQIETLERLRKEFR